MSLNQFQDKLDNQWSTNGGCEKPPVTQEAAPRHNGHCVNMQRRGYGCVCGATAPDWAMRVAEQIGKIVHYSNSEEWTRNAAALIREAGSERERELREALRHVIGLGPTTYSPKTCKECAEASRLLGGE